MPLYTYLNFTPDSEDMNVPGSSDPTKPSEGWKGRDANNALRATNSGLRNLGDVTAQLPLTPDGGRNRGPRFGQIGTAAFQDVEAFQITGGILGPNVRGSVPYGGMIILFCSTAQFDGGAYAECRSRGFDVCDGRTARNPYSPFNDITMPDLRGTFLWGTDDKAKLQSAQFGLVVGRPDLNEANSQRGGFDLPNHRHGTTSIDGLSGETAETILGYDQLPATVVTSVSTAPDAPNPVIATGPDRNITFTSQGKNFGHKHNIADGGARTIANFEIRPPSIAVFYLLRVW